MSNLNLNQIIELLMAVANSGSITTRAVQELLIRLRQSEKKGNFVDDLANDLWALAIPQAGGHFDHDNFISSVPAPKFPRLSRQGLQSSALILVGPFVPTKALCYWLGVHIDERLYFPDDEHGFYRNTRPYWLQVKEYDASSSNLATEHGYDTNLTVNEGLFAFAQMRGKSKGFALEGTIHDNPHQRYFLKLIHGRPTLTSDNVEGISYPSLYGRER